jgi:hypothetical protein
MEHSIGSGGEKDALDQPESSFGDDNPSELLQSYVQNVFDDQSSVTRDDEKNPRNDTAMEETEENFLIQQTAQRLSGDTLESAHFSDSMMSRMSAQEGSVTTRMSWHEDSHSEYRRQMELEM